MDSRLGTGKNYREWLETVETGVFQTEDMGSSIPIFYCKDCKKELINDETIEAVKNLFAEKARIHGMSMMQRIYFAELKCECGCTEFEKEKDIMDVWFDSGSSHAAVLETREA